MSNLQLPFMAEELGHKQKQEKQKHARKSHNLRSEQDFATEIIKHLDKLTALGLRNGDIFIDFLTLCEYELLVMRRRFDCFVDGKDMFVKDEEMKFYEKITNVYGREWAIKHLNKALALLMASPESGFMDVLGSIYMEWGWPSRGAGQFFTPMPVAKMMAYMLASNNDTEVNGRIKEAINKSPIAQAMLIAGSIIKNPTLAQAHLIYNVLPHCMEEFKPVSVNDPCCGSGVMFLAYADNGTWWHNQLGFIQYYGQDIDRVCCQMARINTMLYGLNGFWARTIVYQQGLIWHNSRDLWGNDLGERINDISPNDVDLKNATPHEAVTAELEEKTKPLQAIQLSLFDAFAPNDGGENA